MTTNRTLIDRYTWKEEENEEIQRTTALSLALSPSVLFQLSQLSITSSDVMSIDELFRSVIPMLQSKCKKDEKSFFFLFFSSFCLLGIEYH